MSDDHTNEIFLKQLYGLRNKLLQYCRVQNSVSKRYARYNNVKY